MSVFLFNLLERNSSDLIVSFNYSLLRFFNLEPFFPVTHLLPVIDNGQNGRYTRQSIHIYITFLPLYESAGKQVTGKQDKTVWYTDKNGYYVRQLYETAGM